MTKAYSYARFSSRGQEKGTSIERQDEMRDNWLKRNTQVTLDTRLSLKDMGVSAFRGKNAMVGNLRKFLDAVQDGTVQPGSLLLVESFDRITRQGIDEGYDLIKSILKSGVRIVTLSPEREFGPDAVKGLSKGALEIQLILERAAEESEMKSKRIGRARAKERDKARTEKVAITKQAPAWLRVSQDRRFQLIPEAGKVIREIFKLRAEGVGIRTIAKRLNAGGHWCPPKKARGDKQRTIGWRHGYIKKILHSRAVIGEFQPHTRRDDKRVAEGPPIADYFPRVIDPGIFRKVQRDLEANRGKGGRNGKVCNLLTHLVRCAYCGGPMSYIGCGTKRIGVRKPAKSSSYLACDTARRGRGCEKSRISYPEVEALILENCPKLRPEDVLPTKSARTARVKALRETITARDDEITELSGQIDNYTDQIGRTKDAKARDRYEAKLIELERSRELAIAAKEKASVSMAEAEKDSESFQRWQRDMVGLRKALTAENGSDVRLRLRVHLRELIERIEVFTVGNNRNEEDVTDWVTQVFDELQPGYTRPKDFKAFVKWVGEQSHTRRGRFVRVHFKTAQQPSKHFKGEPVQTYFDFVPEGSIAVGDKRLREGTKWVAPSVQALWDEWQQTRVSGY